MPEKAKSKKLIVQIPAYNEVETIGQVIKAIPRKIAGIKRVEVLVIDDGSRDGTAEAAREAGADFVLKHKYNMGLGKTFKDGIDKALELGADIIVNIDADGQYSSQEISKLIKPILDEKVDIVSGNRQVENLNHMIIVKKYGNIIGSNIVKAASGNGIRDASSGFRAYSREAVLRLFPMSKHTYTHETLIQAKRKNLKVVEVPITFSPRLNGNSRLIRSVYSHIKKSVATITRTTLMYNSMKALGYLGSALIILGLIPFIRWYYLTFIIADGGQHIQSLIVGALLMIFGGFSILLGFIADLIAINRLHLEEILYKLKKKEVNGRE